MIGAAEVKRAGSGEDGALESGGFATGWLALAGFASGGLAAAGLGIIGAGAVAAVSFAGGMSAGVAAMLLDTEGAKATVAAGGISGFRVCGEGAVSPEKDRIWESAKKPPAPIKAPRPAAAIKSGARDLGRGGGIVASAAAGKGVTTLSFAAVSGFRDAAASRLYDQYQGLKVAALAVPLRARTFSRSVARSSLRLAFRDAGSADGVWVAERSAIEWTSGDAPRSPSRDEGLALNRPEDSVTRLLFPYMHHSLTRGRSADAPRAQPNHPTK